MTSYIHIVSYYSARLYNVIIFGYNSEQFPVNPALQEEPKEAKMQTGVVV